MTETPPDLPESDRGPGLSRRELMRIAAALAAAGAIGRAGPAAAASGRSFHVDHDGGDDSRDGLSPAKALRTAPDSGRLRPGDRVLFKGGVRYRGVIDAGRSGTADAPITYDGNSTGEWGDGPAIIDGSEPLDGWTAAGRINGSAVWACRKPPGGAPDILIHQGGGDLGGEPRLCAMAQLPEPRSLDKTEDLGRFHRAKRTWRAHSDGSVHYYVEAPKVFGPDSRDMVADNALVRLHVAGNFVRTYAIIAHDRAKGVVELSPEPVGGERGAPNGSKLLRFALANTRDCLRLPGQFIVEGKTLILRPHDDAEPNAAGLTVARQHDGLRSSGDHVHVRGFRIEKLRAGAGVTGRNGSSGRLTGMRVVGCEVAFCKVSRGIWFERCDESVAYGNHVHDLVEGRGILVSNSRLSTLMKNRIERIKGSCLSVYGGSDCAVVGNRIGNPLGVHSNGMSFYLGNRGTKVLFNTVMIPDASAFAMTMQDAGNMVVAFNTLVSKDFSSFSHHPDKGRNGGEVGGHAWLNNDIMTVSDNRAFRIASPKARKGSMLVNNIGDGFAVNGTAPDPWKARTRNVYTRHRKGGLGKGQLESIGELLGDRGAMFADLDAWDLRPSAAWRDILSKGAEYEISGIRIDWIGRFRPDGREAWDWDTGAP